MSGSGTVVPLRHPRKGQNKRDTWREGEERRQRMMTLLAEGYTVAAACAEIGVKEPTYRQWRWRDKNFGAQCDAMIRRNREVRRLDTEEANANWSDFADFRRAFFRHETPWHQQRVVDELEAAKPGDIVMILMPPEHGKTTLFEDYACWKLALDPDYRITVGTEAQRLARRMISRIKNRMEEDGPFPSYVRRFGPFVPQRNEGRSTRQVWAADYFNVYRRKLSDERDYSMVGIGFSSNIAGTRTDHLHGDDLQSMKTLAQTQKMLETFRQDWLSRPGETGITTINGTRVGDGDIYEAMMEAYDGHELFRVVRLPALVTDPLTKTQSPLWPYDPMTKTGFSLRMLERIRTKVGEEAWARNYMQQPRARSFGTFTEDAVDRTKNYARKIGDTLPVEGAPIYIGLDPALGGINCLVGLQVTSDKLYLLDIVEDQGLSRNEQIMARLEGLIRKYEAMGGHVSDVVIEAVVFQRGLARDERLQELSRTYGFAMREHLTGANKYDPDIGVPSMVALFYKGEIDLPYGDDSFTRDTTDNLRRQLLRWRPGVKGSVLRQDQVMALWFVWILWMSRRRRHPKGASSFAAPGLPWEPTSAGLLVPTGGGSPFFRGE